jgi:hypothetical protein
LAIAAAMTRNVMLALGLAAAMLLGFVLSVPSGARAEGPASGGAVSVDVGLYIISFGNYDANKGTYTMDMYMWFRWNATSAPAGFTVDKFEFMNGRASSKDRIADDTDAVTGVREVWYRVQANLYSDPQFKQYPFDQQRLFVQFEDANLSSNKLVYRPLEDESGLDPQVKVAGWHLDRTAYSTSEKEYKWGEKYSRVTFELDISREPTSTGIKTLLPPIVFCIVSGLSFFFPASKIAQRIGLGTSMLISAVMFHISQTAGLPPLGSLILLDKIMIATYAFLGASLICTALISIDEDFWKEKDYTAYTNKYGGLLTIILPFIVYGALTAV